MAAAHTTRPRGRLGRMGTVARAACAGGGAPSRGPGMERPAPAPAAALHRSALASGGLAGMKVRIGAAAAATAALAAPGAAHGATLAAQGACFVQGAQVPVVGAQWLPGSFISI